ncbi:MAG: hypothetical protein AAF525_01440 [Pseudomonadota bacterium]
MTLSSRLIVSCLVLTCTGLLLASPAAEAARKKQESPVVLDPYSRHVMYERLLGTSEEAYIMSLYYEARGLGPAASLELGRAGLAFDMDLPGLADRILRTVDQTAGNPDQLNLYRANLSYEAGDLSAVGAFLSQMSELGRRPSPRRLYLLAEHAGDASQFEDAAGYLADLPKEHSLRLYGRYNLATRQLANGLVDDADQAFLNLIDLKFKKKKFPELHSIQDRARIALATIRINQNAAREDVFPLLESVDAKGSSGVDAIGMLAREAIIATEHERSAQLLDYLISNRPWHPTVIGLHYLLPAALEEIHGGESVYGIYQSTEGRILDRINSLQAQMTLTRADAVALAHRLTNSEAQALEGHDLPPLWDNASHELAAQLLRLESYSRQLHIHRDTLDVLLEVDQEKQKRVSEFNERFENQAYPDRIFYLTSAVARMRERIESIGESTDLQSTLPLASAEEREILDAVQDLSRKMRNAGPEAQQKLSRLRGFVLYQIADERATRIREKEARVDAFENLLDTANERYAHIGRTEQHFESVSERVRAMIGTTDRMITRADAAADDMSEALIARVYRNIRIELAHLGPQLTQVRLAMARITDEVRNVRAADS